MKSGFFDLMNLIFKWRNYKRSQVIFANTLFQSIAYHPEEFHIITGGSDRKIAYWESYDGAQIRELEASKSGTVNSLDVDATGSLIITASSDKLVKVSGILCCICRIRKSVLNVLFFVLGLEI